LRNKNAHANADDYADVNASGRRKKAKKKDLDGTPKR